jgi:iron complex outermembrane receptor protein
LPTPAALGEMSVRLDYFYQSVSYTQDNNTNLVTGQRLVSQTIPSYHNYNLRAEWTNVLSKPLDLSVFVRNLTKEEYFIAGTDLTAALGSSAMVPGEPRNFGVGLKYRF